MKTARITFSSTFLFILCSLSYAQQGNWIQQSPPSISVDLNDLYMVNASTAIAVGAGGMMIKTTDAGATWTTLPSGTSNTLLGIFFINPSTGWIFGSYSLLKKTIDSGATWVSQTTGVGAYVSLRAIHFVDASTGWLVASDNKIRKTTDGGATWNVQYTVTASYVSLEDVYFSNANVGLVIGYSMGSGEIFRTTDGGLTWTSVDMGNSWFNKVVFISSQIGWAVGFTATTISYTSDPFGGGGISISGAKSAVWKTTDGGITWASGVFPASQPLNVFFSDALTGWITGGGGLIFKTRHGKQTHWVRDTH
jgi:photosystem II stability/assembly factor-like uncharacterized protein